MVSSKQAKGGKEIPTPDVRVVPSYSVEYLPVHKEPRVYIRGKGRIHLLDWSAAQVSLRSWTTLVRTSAVPWLCLL